MGHQELKYLLGDSDQGLGRSISQGPEAVELIGVEVQAVSGTQNDGFGICGKLQPAFEDKGKLFTLVAELDHLLGVFDLKSYQEWFHSFEGLGRGQGFIGVAKLGFSLDLSPGGDDSLIAADHCGFDLLDLVLKEEADVRIQAVGDLEQSGNGGRDLFVFYLRDEGLGKTGLLRQLLEAESLVVPHVTDLFPHAQLTEIFANRCAHGRPHYCRWQFTDNS